MVRYYIADMWSTGDTNYCYIITISPTKGVKVFVALALEDKYILEDDVTIAVSNTVPLAEMFCDAYEVEQRQIYSRIEGGEVMPRKKEYETAILVRISKEQHDKLQKIATAKGQGVAETVREYIKRAKMPKK